MKYFKPGRLTRLLRLAGWLTLWLLVAKPVSAEAVCTYQTWSRNTETKSAVNYETVRKPYNDLTAEEIDPLTGCSVCEQDQVEIDLPPLKPFRICRFIAARIEPVLERMLRMGEPINTVIGYRVGRTRGEVDDNGLRTGFSNHSFGIALDINPDLNGLYGNCSVFSADCQLLRGGKWLPNRPGTMTSQSRTVIELQKAGLLWGGQIAGRQKDFMHFSPTGY